MPKLISALHRRLRRSEGVTLAMVVIAMSILAVLAAGLTVSLRSSTGVASDSDARYQARDLAYSLNELGVHQARYVGVPDFSPGKCYWWSKSGAQPGDTAGCTKLTSFSTSEATDAITHGLFTADATGEVIIRFEDPHTGNSSIGAAAEPADSTVYARMVVTSNTTVKSKGAKSQDQSSSQTSVYDLTFG
ncbi:hypothetical protein F8O07_06770 [Pseudoclavibacter sp. CFCC 13796]|uniref:type IV pilus modification PilV family protein n=1 Tax=Pseudoclavibacter sp. CFCC 13796 TaxID=2615179 RepID=UPI001300DB7B|nr:hypothetical protein [Pseudoclavibacter sp. CFCC 13796]KAB1661601.1 hypothetical protein F8O07_06770 [Pseudoclavibacter sp. CFCC 13796]